MVKADVDKVSEAYLMGVQHFLEGRFEPPNRKKDSQRIEEIDNEVLAVLGSLRETVPQAVQMGMEAQKAIAVDVDDDYMRPSM